MVKIRFRLANRRSNVAAPARMNTIFTSSEGWKVMGPTAIQFLAAEDALAEQYVEGQQR